MIRLWRPAAASVIARLAASCPREFSAVVPAVSGLRPVFQLVVGGGPFVGPEQALLVFGQVDGATALLLGPTLLWLFLVFSRRGARATTVCGYRLTGLYILAFWLVPCFSDACFPGLGLGLSRLIPLPNIAYRGWARVRYRARADQHRSATMFRVYYPYQILAFLLCNSLLDQAQRLHSRSLIGACALMLYTVGIRKDAYTETKKMINKMKK